MTDHYAVIGNPVAHSKSPLLHRAFARQSAQDMHYDTILGPLGGFVETVRKFQDEGGKGLNSTVPFKQEAFRLADELSDRARAAGAVNTFTFRADDTILGDNTDGWGIVRDITCNLRRPLAGQRVLLLGAGGAVRGVLLQLLAQQPSELFIANRTISSALDLVSRNSQQAGATRLAGGGFAEAGGRYDIIINGTTSSLAGVVLPLPAEVWDADTLAYDMYYKNEPTVFVLSARAAGVKLASDGLGMLVEQGAESFFQWRGVRPDTAPVIAALR